MPTSGGGEALAAKYGPLTYNMICENAEDWPRRRADRMTGGLKWA
jgi:hypothetical protein